MAVLLGVGVTDVSGVLGIGQTHMGPSKCTLAAGWIRPATLTAGRNIFGEGSLVWGVKIHTTTSELRIMSDATTDGAYTTSGLGLTVGQWQWVCIMCYIGTSSTMTVKCYTAIESGPMTEVTVVVTTAAVGSFGATAGTNPQNGNQGGGASQAFEGEIEQFVWMSGLRNIIILSSALGTPSTADLEQNVRALVVPLWAGDQESIMRGGIDFSATTTQNPWRIVCPFVDCNVATGSNSQNLGRIPHTQSTPPAGTHSFSGTGPPSWTQTRAPRPAQIRPGWAWMRR